MRVRVMAWCCAVALLGACGGGSEDAAEDDDAVVATGGDEDTGDDLGTDDDVVDVEDDGDAEAEDDGLRCLPVSRCHSFANQACALVDEAGEIQDEGVEGDVRQACPGERGIADSVTECFDYIETGGRCGRTPDLVDPQWPCGRTETARCDIVMM